MALGRFDRERGELVAILKERGILSDRVLRAVGKVERHLFVQEPFLNRAYEDTALPIGKGQTISQPYTVAVMTESLDLKQGDRVLEIGTGSGYQAAILAEMGAKVYSIERDLGLLEGARKVLDQLGYRVASKAGDGTVGWQEFAPYQGIVVTAGAPDVPKPLLDQLDDGGRLVIPIGGQEIQSLWVITRRGSSYDRRVMDGFKFVPLIGKMGWS
jgi:protein-L-isoaspartate(D-aspartate) O-methyltransferase